MIPCGSFNKVTKEHLKILQFINGGSEEFPKLESAEIYTVRVTVIQLATLRPHKTMLDPNDV